MKVFFFTLLLASTLGLNLNLDMQSFGTSQSEPHGNNVVIFPEQIISVVQENCGDLDSWASDVVNQYGGADGELSE